MKINAASLFLTLVALTAASPLAESSDDATIAASCSRAGKVGCNNQGCVIIYSPVI